MTLAELSRAVDGGTAIAVSVALKRFGARLAEDRSCAGRWIE